MISAGTDATKATLRADGPTSSSGRYRRRPKQRQVRIIMKRLSLDPGGAVDRDAAGV